MPFSVDVIFYSTAAAAGAWVDISKAGSDWTLHLEQIGSDSVSVEVSNEIPATISGSPPGNDSQPGTTPNPNAPAQLRAAYPPYPPPSPAPPGSGNPGIAIAGFASGAVISHTAPAVPDISYILYDSANNGGQALVIAKSDLNVKWLRVRKTVVSGGGSPTVAFLHIGK